MVPRLTQVEGEAEGVVHEHLIRYGFGSAAQDYGQKSGLASWGVEEGGVDAR